LLSLAKEAGIKIHRSNKAIVYHRVTDERRTYRYFVRRVFWEGRTQILREKFIKHLCPGVATMVISFFRWLIYATSFAFYIYGALYQFLLAKINKTKN